MNLVKILAVFGIVLGIFSLKVGTSNAAPNPQTGIYACGWRNSTCAVVTAGCQPFHEVPGSACQFATEGECVGKVGNCVQLQATPGQGGGTGWSTVAGPEPTSCGSGGEGFQTAIGCIPVNNPNGFATFVLRWGMGIAGGIALVLIGVSGFMITTSIGNPQKLQAGKELLTAAISGIILLLFGVFALRFVSIDILGLDQFGFGS